MKRPPTFAEAHERGLIPEHGKGIHTFSNGTAWDCWADANCYQCWFYDWEAGGERCAFEWAAFMHEVSPALAEMFGWTRDEQYPDSWVEPEECAFYRDRPDGDDDNPPLPPPPDPLQLNLLADPTEDAALLDVEAPELAEVTA